MEKNAGYKMDRDGVGIYGQKYKIIKCTKCFTLIYAKRNCNKKLSYWDCNRREDKRKKKEGKTKDYRHRWYQGRRLV